LGDRAEFEFAADIEPCRDDETTTGSPGRDDARDKIGLVGTIELVQVVVVGASKPSASRSEVKKHSCKKCEFFPVDY